MILFQDKLQNIRQNKEPVLTKFLTATEQAQIKGVIRNELDYVLDGGYPDAERKRAKFYDDDNIMITCFKISYNGNYLTLSHQNVLGSLMALQIQREAIGDIIVPDGVFFVISELKEYILREFTMIGSIPITLEETNGRNVKHHVSLQEFTSYMDSLRLDLVISRITKLSRKQSVEYIENDMIKVNQLITTKHTKILGENDVISIRKYGRFILLDTSRTSRKGKIIVKYGKYV